MTGRSPLSISAGKTARSPVLPYPKARCFTCMGAAMAFMRGDDVNLTMGVIAWTGDWPTHPLQPKVSIIIRELLDKPTRPFLVVCQRVLPQSQMPLRHAQLAVVLASRCWPATSAPAEPAKVILRAGLGDLIPSWPEAAACAARHAPPKYDRVHERAGKRKRLEPVRQRTKPPAVIAEEWSRSLNRREKHPIVNP